MSIKVTAIQKGYYGLLTREPGHTFSIEDESEFSKKWMIKGHQSLSPEELVSLARESKRRTQAQVIASTKGSPSAPVSVVVPAGIRASDKSPI